MQYGFHDILQRVTIKDILIDYGFSPKRNRIACPIHGGDNPSSFRFTDHNFICFSCGARGGLIDLAMSIAGSDKSSTVRYLCELADIPYESPNSANHTQKIISQKPLTFTR